MQRSLGPLPRALTERPLNALHFLQALHGDSHTVGWLRGHCPIATAFVHQHPPVQVGVDRGSQHALLHHNMPCPPSTTSGGGQGLAEHLKKPAPEGWARATWMHGETSILPPSLACGGVVVQECQKRSRRRFPIELNTQPGISTTTGSQRRLRQNLHGRAVMRRQLLGLQAHLAPHAPRNHEQQNCTPINAPVATASACVTAP